MVGMGFRFHKSIRLLPCLRLNLSKSGIGFSVGIPGTGLSYRTSFCSIGKVLFLGTLCGLGGYAYNAPPDNAMQYVEQALRGLVASVYNILQK